MSNTLQLGEVQLADGRAQVYAAARPAAARGKEARAARDQ